MNQVIKMRRVQQIVLKKYKSVFKEKFQIKSGLAYQQDSNKNRIVIIKMFNYDVHQQEDSDLKNRLSNSTTHSEDTAGQKDSQGQLLPCLNGLTDVLPARNQLLANKVEQPEITEKTTHKAISWLISTCWTNDLADQTLYISIIIFYCYKANRIIPKAKLQLILLSSIYLSSKKCQTKKFKIDDALALSTKNFTAEDLIQTEYQMLQLLDYNLEFEHNLIKFFWRPDIQQEKNDQIQFLTQLSLFQSSDILFQNDAFQELIQTVLRQSRLSNCQLAVLKLSKLKQTKVLSNKYTSKFDVEEFLNDLFELYQ